MFHSLIGQANTRSCLRTLGMLECLHRRRLSHDAIERLKHPSRGGQDLTHRYKRLERSLRGKETYTHQLSEYAPLQAAPNGPTVNPAPAKNELPTFRGFVIPEEPKPPQPDECCMSGCALCVHDLYQESLDAYDQAISSLRISLSALNIPESEWPTQIQVKEKGKMMANVNLSAFEQLEISLKAKHSSESGPR